jgi:hypothetical protein
LFDTPESFDEDGVSAEKQGAALNSVSTVPMMM